MLAFLSDAGDHLLAEQCPQGLSDTGVPVSSTKATGYNVWLGIGRGQRTRTGQVLDSTFLYISGIPRFRLPCGKRAKKFQLPATEANLSHGLSLRCQQNCDQTVTKLVISEISPQNYRRGTVCAESAKSWT